MTSFLKMKYGKLLLWAIQTSIFLLDCNALKGEKIIGGEIAANDKYPYHVYITKEGDPICGGGLIGQFHVITAAHCVADPFGKFDGKPLYAVGGIIDLHYNPSSRQESFVDKVYIPTRYKTDYQQFKTYDIAVLKLFQSLDFGEGSYLVLPRINELHTGEYATLTGHGWNEINFYKERQSNIARVSGRSDLALRSATVKILSPTECKNLWSLENPPTARMCGKMEQRSPKNPAGVCEGDSGSPLVINNTVIVGVLNNGPISCTEEKRSGLYARVSSYFEFINQAVADEEVDTISSIVLSPFAHILDKSHHDPLATNDVFDAFEE